MHSMLQSVTPKPVLCCSCVSCGSCWQGLDVQLAEGQSLLIMGASGCGKSSLLRAISGSRGTPHKLQRCTVVQRMRQVQDVVSPRRELLSCLGRDPTCMVAWSGQCHVCSADRAFCEIPAVTLP